MEVHKYLHSPHLVLDLDYYIQKKMIPPLARIFNVIGAPVALWYKEMPKFRRPRVFVDDGKKKAATLDGWLIRDDMVCHICRAKTSSGKSKISSPSPPSLEVWTDGTLKRSAHPAMRTATCRSTRHGCSYALRRSV